MTHERCPADLLGQAYEWTIAKFAAASGKRGGEFYTPAQVGKLGARLLAPEPRQDVYDPTCGSGSTCQANLCVPNNTACLPNTSCSQDWFREMRQFDTRNKHAEAEYRLEYLHRLKECNPEEGATNNPCPKMSPAE